LSFQFSVFSGENVSGSFFLKTKGKNICKILQIKTFTITSVGELQFTASGGNPFVECQTSIGETVAFGGRVQPYNMSNILTIKKKQAPFQVTCD
jgi:hypothetical protein